MTAEDKTVVLREIQTLRAKVARFADKYKALKQENEELKARMQPLEAQARTVDLLKEHLQDVETQLSVEQRKRLALQASLAQMNQRRQNAEMYEQQRQKYGQGSGARHDQQEKAQWQDQSGRSDQLDPIILHSPERPALGKSTLVHDERGPTSFGDFQGSNEGGANDSAALSSDSPVVKALRAAGATLAAVAAQRRQQQLHEGNFEEHFDIDKSEPEAVAVSAGEEPEEEIDHNLDTPHQREADMDDREGEESRVARARTQHERAWRKAEQEFQAAAAYAAEHHSREHPREV
jgi:hypothetical protein